MRQESIGTLKEAIKNKTLTCYQTSDYDIEPLYYDADFNTCCVVGKLFSKKELDKYADDNGNVSTLFKSKKTFIAEILDEIQKDSLFGFTQEELHMMQKLHDTALQGDLLETERGVKEAINKFENYINTL